jgi:hypothetical protein
MAWDEGAGLVLAGAFRPGQGGALSVGSNHPAAQPYLLA